jgi:6-pyruvoyltetrahydropterin/6-carboxytetrahydropterin synthase
MTFLSTKTYDHNVGLSACYRQWRAESHCRFIHGYALAFNFVFQAIALDERGWVIDFGGLDPLKRRLQSTFDHKLLVAADDPHMSEILTLRDKGLADVIVLDRVGCEAFAQLAWLYAYDVTFAHHKRVKVMSCEVKEHTGNSAIYMGEK